MCSRHASLETKRRCGRSRGGRHTNADGLRIGATGGQPEKGVMPVRHDLGLSDGHAFAGDREPGPAQVGAMQQKHGGGQADPPVRRIDFVDARCAGRCSRGTGRQRAFYSLRNRRGGRSGAGQQQRSKSKQPVEGLHGVTFRWFRLAVLENERKICATAGGPHRGASGSTTQNVTRRASSSSRLVGERRGFSSWPKSPLL